MSRRVDSGAEVITFPDLFSFYRPRQRHGPPSLVRARKPGVLPRRTERATIPTGSQEERIARGASRCSFEGRLASEASN